MAQYTVVLKFSTDAPAESDQAAQDAFTLLRDVLPYMVDNVEVEGIELGVVTTALEMASSVYWDTSRDENVELVVRFESEQLAVKMDNVALQLKS